MSVLDIDIEEIRFLVDEIKVEAEVLHDADAAAILAHVHSWCVIDTPYNSIRHMSDEELKQAIVEDLLNVTYWEKEGKVMTFTPAHLTRHVPARMHPRVNAGFLDPFVQSLLDNRDDGQVRIHMDHMQDAMDFAGVWHEGFIALTGEPVYTAAE